MSKNIEALEQAFYESPEFLKKPYLDTDFINNPDRYDLLVNAIAETVLNNCTSDAPLPSFVLGTFGVTNTIVEDVAAELSSHGNEIEALKTDGAISRPKICYESLCKLRNGEKENRLNSVLIIDDFARTGRRISKLASALDVRFSSPTVEGLVIVKKNKYLRSLWGKKISCTSVIPEHYS